MRSKRIKWTVRVLRNMSLERQTVQLIFFLIDHVALAEPPGWMKLELLVVACIYLVLKLQGDITASVSQFNDFVTHTLLIPRGTLIKAELAVVALIPPNFAFLTTFSDFLCSCFPSLESRTDPHYALVTRACELCMGVYLFDEQPFELGALSAAALLEAGRQNGFAGGLSEASVVEFFQTSVPVGFDQVQFFVEGFVDENRYAKDIFASG